MKARTGDEHLNRVGIDVLDVNRIQKAIERNRRFKNKIYTENEIHHIEKKNSYKTAGGIFASKEAVSKLLGTGISGFSWKDIEIKSDKRGKPTVVLHNNARRIAGEQKLGDLEISISHSEDIVVAVALGTVREGQSGDLADKLLPRRSRDAHKGYYGKVALIGGSKGMAGSIYLSSISSLRSGSGLVYTLVPEAISTVVEIKSIENIVVSIKDKGKGYLNTVDKALLERLSDMDAIGLGPGMSKKEGTIEFLREILKKVDKPYVIDADGINNLAGLRGELKSFNRKIAITPHLAELARFIEVPISELVENRQAYAVSTAKTYGIVVVLKGRETIVTDGDRVYVNTTGNPGMATAGSGDVLTGTITSFVGQGYDIFEASKIGVYLHGLAGDMASYQIGEYGLIASDIVDYLPKAIRRVEYREE